MGTDFFHDHVGGLAGRKCNQKINLSPFLRNLAISSLLASCSAFLILMAGCKASPEDTLVRDSQGNIDLKESMKGKREIVVPLDQLNKIDPEQLKGKKQEIVFPKKPKMQGQRQGVLEKGGRKIEDYTTPVEENLQGITITPDETEAIPRSEENTQKPTH
ncbi:MAG: hypothetical protein Q7R68_05670 [Nitrospirales bacterium]|nr:hypothetical protein [Nitrospirales bacterium]